MTETDARGNTTTHTYNALDQRIRTTFADSTSIASTFDKRGLEIAKSDQNGRTTNYAFDGLGRLTSVTDVLNQVTNYAYDEAGNKLTQTDALGRVTRWAYDALGRPASRILPLGQAETYGYDVVGNRISHTDFNGATHTFTYDANNDWLTGESWADGRSTSYTYNAIGQRASATDSNGTFSYSYDDRGRLINETKHDDGQLTYEYDAAGNRTTLEAFASGSSTSTAYTFDVLNRLATVTANDNTVTTYGYDANGNQTSVSHGNGTSTDTTFDSLNRVTAITHLGTTDETIGSFSYTLDPTGRRTQIVEANGRTSTYTYDDLYRLVGESITDAVNGDHASSYQYDAVGNRVIETVNGVQTAYSVDDNDRLLQQGGTTYTYDANGNTLSDSLDGNTNTYNYDSQNRLTGSSKNGQSIAMTYDMDGNRLSQSVDGDTTAFLVNTNMPYAQVLIESNSLETLQYTFGSDLLSLVSGLETYTYHTDALGSTRLLSDSVGQVVDEMSYDAWGELLGGGLVGENKYLYTGEQFDGALGDYYLRARYYNTSASRFLTTDTWPGIPFSPLTLNAYAYVSSDPVSNVDPSGHFLVSLLSRSSIQSALATASRGTSILGPFGSRAVKAGAKATAIVCFAQAVSSLMNVPEASSKAGQTGCYLNVVRVQLQQGSRSDRVISKVASWAANPGVSINHVRGKLNQLYLARRNGGWFPKELDQWMFRSIVSLSKQLTGIPAAGGVRTVGNIMRRETFVKKDEYRVDVENLRGHNLRW